MKKLLLNLTFTTLLLSVAYSQCDESNWVSYYPSMQGCDLSGANLSGEYFYGANLSGAILSWADLNGANLFYANLSGADFNGANLSGANLYWADLNGANLSGANLSGAYLNVTNLSGANLSWADLSEANLPWADLSGANLSGANLYWADLGSTNLEGACLEGAIDFLQPNYLGIPVLEGCTPGVCSFEDIDEDGYDDTSFAAGVASVDANNDGLVDTFPTLSIINGSATVLMQGSLDQYTDDGASCSDQEDGDISQNVEVSGQVVNMNIPGTYTVSYDCSDSDGNAAQTKSRTVFVVGSLIADENGDGFDDDAFLAGAQSGDISGNGALNITDIIMYIELIINAD